ncbi:MAG: GAF domain-containing protein [Anaerolineae bacterium]|nr:GAF domain-containing protein [Anaerolineae bacterium]
MSSRATAPQFIVPPRSQSSPLERLFDFRHTYTDILEYQHARMLAGMCIAIGALSLLSTVVAWFVPDAPGATTTVGIIMILLCAGFYWLVNTGSLRWASVGFVLALIGVIFWASSPYGISESAVGAFALPVVSACMLLGATWGFLLTLVAEAGIGTLTYLSIRAGVGTEDAVSSAVVSGIFLLIMYGATIFLVRSLLRWGQNTQRKASQLEAAALINQAVTTASSVSDLLNMAVERVREVFGFYHVQVFLLDQQRSRENPRLSMARLESSTGHAGAMLLTNGHALMVGSRSIVGQATYYGQPVIVNDVQTSSIFHPNELLPDTRAEVALPLMIGENVIGALDVQSTMQNSFFPEDISALQVIANQLAGFIERTRLVAELQRRATERQSLLEDAQTNLRQIEALNRQLTREGWTEYLRSHRAPGTMGYTLQGKRVQADTSWTAPMRQAFSGERSVVIRQDQQAHIAAVPLRIRGEVVGVLEIEREGSQPWTDTELEMVETMVDRLGLAVENARLYEQATLAAEREHVVNRIAQDVQEAESIDEILQSALTELSAVLGASRGIVQISPKDVEITDVETTSVDAASSQLPTAETGGLPEA